MRPSASSLGTGGVSHSDFLFRIYRPCARRLGGRRCGVVRGDRGYPPYDGAIAPGDDTVVCRCEDVTAGEIRSYAELGCLGPNRTKALGRAGMGPCQGRYCGLTMTALLATATGQTPDETAHYRKRLAKRAATTEGPAVRRAARTGRTNDRNLLRSKSLEKTLAKPEPSTNDSPGSGAAPDPAAAENPAPAGFVEHAGLAGRHALLWRQ